MGLILYHRPKEKEIQNLINQHNLYGILTILSEKEVGKLISAYDSYNINHWWHRYSIKKRELVSDYQWHSYRYDLNEIAEDLMDDKNILIHCSAGIHRTGTNAYAILRRLGYNRDEAYKAVCQLRPESADCYKFLDFAEEYLI